MPRAGLRPTPAGRALQDRAPSPRRLWKRGLAHPADKAAPSAVSSQTGRVAVPDAWTARLHICDPTPGLHFLRVSVRPPPHHPRPHVLMPSQPAPVSGATGCTLQASRCCTVARNVLALAHRGQWAQTPHPTARLVQAEGLTAPLQRSAPPPRPIGPPHPPEPQGPGQARRSGPCAGCVVEQDPGAWGPLPAGQRGDLVQGRTGSLLMLAAGRAPGP